MDAAVAQRIVEVGHARYGGVSVSIDALLAYFHQREAPSPEHDADYFLAAACALRDPVALEIFDSQFIAHVPTHIARIGKEPDFVSDVAQILRSRMLVGSPSSPGRIADYAGRGPLHGWVRIAAIRCAIDLRRGSRDPSKEDDDAATKLASGADPEMQYIRSRYGTEFREAFAHALEQLAPRDRTILKLYLVDGLNIDAIGKVYDVHRATVARWIQVARSSLYEGTRDKLQLELKLSTSEFESLLGVIRSDLNVSVCRLLRAAPPDIGT